VKAARLNPSRFNPFADTLKSEYKKKGGTSLFTRELPPIIANRPIFEYW
jgi:hypothetical protein